MNQTSFKEIKEHCYYTIVYLPCPGYNKRRRTDPSSNIPSTNLPLRILRQEMSTRNQQQF